METIKQIDERFADPSLLEYNLICFKCNKSSKECKCDDKWLRLRHFRMKLNSARASVCIGFGTKEQRDLVNKFGI